MKTMRLFSSFFTKQTRRNPAGKRSAPWGSTRHRTAAILLAAALLVPALGPGAAAQEKVSVVTSADHRFTDNGDQTITDTQTGLMWMKMDSFLHTGQWMNWFEAKQYVQTLNEKGFAQHHDWQVPTLGELRTLYEPEKTNSAQLGREMKIHIDPIFAKKGCGALWSIESNGHFNALGVIFNTGLTFNSSKQARSRRAVRAVRHIAP